MIHDPQHTLTAITVTHPQRLRLVFADGAAFDLDLTPIIRAYPSLAALSDPALFATARLDARGGYVVWIDEELEMAADNLRHIAVEQAGGIGHERLLNWMHENGLTQARAADAIGISRRMLNYYLSGAKPIPKTVWLACFGWKCSQTQGLAA
jgi:hypothetical protein